MLVSLYPFGYRCIWCPFGHQTCEPLLGFNFISPEETNAGEPLSGFSVSILFL